jgi:hypothetical protein
VLEAARLRLSNVQYPSRWWMHRWEHGIRYTKTPPTMALRYPARWGPDYAFLFFLILLRDIPFEGRGRKICDWSVSVMLNQYIVD